MQKTYPKKVFSDSPKKTIFLHKPIALRLSFNRLSSKFEKHKKKVDRQKKPLIPSLSSIFSLKNKEQKSKEIKQRILKQKPNINSKMINFYKEKNFGINKEKSSQNNERTSSEPSEKAVKRKFNENLLPVCLENLQDKSRKYSDLLTKSTMSNYSISFPKLVVMQKVEKNIRPEQKFNGKKPNQDPKRPFSELEILNESKENANCFQLKKIAKNEKTLQQLKKLNGIPKELIFNSEIFSKQIKSDEDRKKNEKKLSKNLTTLIAKLSLSFDNKIFEKMDEILEEYKNQKKQLPYKELQELITNNKNKQVGNLINLREYIKLSKESPKNSKQKQIDEKPEITNKIDLPPSPLKNTTHIKPKDSPKNIFHNVNKSQAPEKQKPSPQKMLFNFQKIDPLPEIPLLQQKQPEEAKKISPIEIKEIFLPKEIKKETKTKCLLTDIFSNKNDILPPLKLKNSLENSDHEAISKNSVLESVIIKRPLQINEVSNNSQNNAQFEETKQTINDKAIDLFEETNLKIQPFEPVISNEIINQQSNLNGLGNVVSLNQTNPFNFQSKQLDNFQGQNNLNQIFSLFNAPAQNFQPTPITNSINTINNNNNQVYNPNLTQNNYANITQNPIPLINNLVPNNSMPYNTPNFVPNNAIANNNMPIFHHTSTNSNNLFNWGNNTNNCNIKTTMSLEDQINERKIFELQTQNNRIMLENECSANEQKKSLDISFSNNDIFATNINNNNNIGYYNNNNNQIVNNNHQYNNNINVPNDINNTITNLFSKKEVIPANNNNQNPIFSFHTPIASLFNNTNTNNGYNETNYNNSLAPKPENRGMERKPIDDVEARMIAKGKQQIKNTLRSNNY